MHNIICEVALLKNCTGVHNTTLWVSKQVPDLAGSIKKNAE